MIEQALICSAIITTIHVSTWDGMIAGKLRSKMLYRLPLFVRKPLYECLICMCSVWGTAYYLLNFNFEWMQWITFVLTVGGINTLIYGVVGNAEDSNGEEFVNDAEKKRIEAMYKVVRKDMPDGSLAFGVVRKDGKEPFELEFLGDDIDDVDKVDVIVK